MKLVCVFYLHIHTLVLEKYSGIFLIFFFSFNFKPCSNNICILLLTASVAVNRGFEPRPGQIKAITLVFVASSLKHTALRRKSKDWLAQNQNNVSEWSDMSTRVFQRTNTIKNQLSVFV
jgi:hypothetical protein